MAKQQVFSATQFTPTEFDTAEDKAKFANQYVALVLSGFAPHKFPEWFYRRLSNTFDHIAHYDKAGFWDEWFSNLAVQIAFLEDALRYFPCGFPTHTYSDVERALQVWLKAHPEILQDIRNKLADRLEAEQRRDYEALKAKFEPHTVTKEG